MMETGAILIYLAEKHGKFLPVSGKARTDVLQWLMWQMGGQGPILGQVHHFTHFNQGVSDYAEERYANEAKRLYGVLNKQLSDKEFIAGDYSIADMACWPWVSRYEWQQIDLGAFPNVRRWYKDILARKAVQKGYHVPKVMPEIPSSALICSSDAASFSASAAKRTFITVSLSWRATASAQNFAK